MCLIVKGSYAQVGIINTIAGIDSAGYNGDNVPASVARLNGPEKICLDKDNNIYIADDFNHRVRKINAATGIITTVAGNGTPGFSGDGGPAVNAQLQVPDGVALDRFGNLYIADGANQRIRKVTPAGIISTVAGTGTGGGAGDGGPAINAQLYVPAGIATDYAGNVYIADYYNNRLRKIDVASGNIYTIAGNGLPGYTGNGGPATDAKLGNIIEVFADSAGNAYIGEQSTGVVRRVDAVTGEISLIAGNGVFGYGGDGNIATNANLAGPTGIFIDRWGNMYIAEYSNSRIRRVDGTTHIITTVAGIGWPGFSGDGGPATSAKIRPGDVAIDNGGNIIIADYENSRIRKVNGPLAVSEVKSGGKVSVYPNPSGGRFMLECAVEEADCMITDVAGRIIYSAHLQGKQNIVDISNAPMGIYFVRVEGEWWNEVVKVEKE